MVYNKRENFPTGSVSNKQGDKDQLKQERYMFNIKYDPFLKKTGKQKFKSFFIHIAQYEKIQETSMPSLIKDGKPKGKTEETQL